MLYLKRAAGESIVILHAGARIVVRMAGLQGRSMLLGVDAPADARILRAEIEHAPPPGGDGEPKATA